jgi:hypothetical protein
MRKSAAQPDGRWGRVRLRRTHTQDTVSNRMSIPSQRTCIYSPGAAQRANRISMHVTGMFTCKCVPWGQRDVHVTGTFMRVCVVAVGAA